MELNKKTVRTLLLGAAGCVVLYWLLHETERLASVLRIGWSILSPFIIGAAIAFILNVPMRAVERWFSKIGNTGARRAVAILVTLVIILLVLAGVFYLLIPQVGETVETLVDKLPAFFSGIIADINAYLSENPEALEWLQENTNFANLDWASLIQKAVSIVSDSLTTVVDKLFTTVVGVGSGIFNAIISLVFALYCLARKEILASQFRRVLYALVPEKVGDEVVRIMRMTNSTFSNFISGQCLEALILGLMFAVCMSIFGMPYMPLVSVVIAVTALVPIVGAFAGCIVGAFFILVDSPLLAVWFVVMFLILQQIEGNLIYPRVVGTSIGLPGMWVLLAVAVGGDLMGVGGMLLMIPVTSVLYALIREFADKRLEDRQIDPDKLVAHPPELKSGFKENREKRRKKFKLRKMLRMEKKNQK
ncbi:MAG: AI-2E family transporter [Oscillospiraceae bacterium]|nr:AI-2E family transporter [Oscillospiraceae bacterium]